MQSAALQQHRALQAPPGLHELLRSCSGNAMPQPLRLLRPARSRRQQLCREQQTRCMASIGGRQGGQPGQHRIVQDPDGQQRIKVTVAKPMGMVLGERERGGPVVVEELVAGGNAAKTGVVQIGDVLSKVSATVLRAGKQHDNEGYGSTPFQNFERIWFDCSGQTFGSVMGAISSNNERWGIMSVQLELVRPAAAASSRKGQERGASDF